MNNLKQYILLMRLDKPIGILLLLWPTLWALWLASDGKPPIHLFAVFVLGVIVMRSAGCVINDIADRRIDKHVERTKNRPLTANRLTLSSAVILFFVLMVAAFCLVLTLNTVTIVLAFVGAGLAVLYPLLKRITHWPQLGLGLAFAWGVPMAFAAINPALNSKMLILFSAAVLWPIIYDTIYAMIDLKDDLRISVKSTAILFGNKIQIILAVMQFVFVGILISCGMVYQLAASYFFSLLLVTILFSYQQWLIKLNKPFQAFYNNHWVGLVIFIGIILGLQG